MTNFSNQITKFKREGEQVFGVAHVFASFNDTFIHVTDLSGRETLVRITGFSLPHYHYPSIVSRRGGVLLHSRVCL